MHIGRFYSVIFVKKLYVTSQYLINICTQDMIHFNIIVLFLTGVVGGSHYSQPGGGSNYLCLRSDPVFREDDPGVARIIRATVHGAEYQHPYKDQLHDHNVPCAICQVTHKTALMMPGTNLCDEGWTTEYVGYIAAERDHTAHHRSEFICVDDDAEPSDRSNPIDQNGVLLQPTQTICGSLPCLPYVKNKDLLCVVCSR